MNALIFKDVEKKYLQQNVLTKLNLSLPAGQTIALLDPNGSGKSTIFKMITGLQRPTAGTIQILDHSPGKPSSLAKIAYLPEKSFLPQNIRINEIIQYYQSFFADFDNNKMTNLLTFMDLHPDNKIKTLSQGMLRRLELALILSRNAQLVLLDEPFNSIDPLSREKILKAIIREHSFGESTLIIATHLIEEIENLVERVLFLKEGSIVLDFNLEDQRYINNKSLKELYCEVFEK